MKTSLASALAAASVLALGCARAPAENAGPPSFAEVAAARPRVLWVAAHPDDESMSGGVLAKLCIEYRSDCHFLVFNRGTGGECCLEGGCKPDLATVRHRELEGAARLYRATLENYEFFNASLPVESFPTREKLEQRWMNEGDPAGLVARAIRRFRPDVLVTLDPYRGFTGHPEHQAAGRFAIAGARRAADAKDPGTLVAGEAPHQVRFVYNVLNKYWFMGLAGDPGDPKPHSETVASDGACDTDRHGRVRSCIEVTAENTRVHASQDSDMGAIRAASKFWGTAYLRRLDPFGEEASALVAELGSARGRDAPLGAGRPLAR